MVIHSEISELDIELTVFTLFERNRRQSDMLVFNNNINGILI